MLYAILGGREVWGRMDICICMAAEKPMATHSSTLAWKSKFLKYFKRKDQWGCNWPLHPTRMEEPGRLKPMGSRRVGHDWATSLSCIEEGNGNPLQCSCLENPRDGGAWGAAVYGVAHSRTRLKRLSSSSSICMAESLHCSPETITAVNQLYPNAKCFWC